MDNSWIDRGYYKYALMDSWTLDEAADLLSGVWVDRDYELESWHPNSIKDDLIHLLERPNLLKVEVHNGVKWFLSKEVVEWAIKKGFNVPPKLLELMELKKPSPNRARAQNDCEEWFDNLIKISKGIKSKSKPQIRKDAKKEIPGLSVRAFDSVWAQKTQGLNWDKAGRPGKASTTKI